MNKSPIKKEKNENEEYENALKMMEKWRTEKLKKSKKLMEEKKKKIELKKTIELYKLNPKYCKRQKEIKDNKKIAENNNFYLSDYQKMIVNFVKKYARTELLDELKSNMDIIYNQYDDNNVGYNSKPKNSWDTFIEQIEAQCPDNLLNKFKNIANNNSIKQNDLDKFNKYNKDYKLQKEKLEYILLAREFKYLENEKKREKGTKRHSIKKLTVRKDEYNLKLLDKKTKAHSTKNSNLIPIINKNQMINKINNHDKNLNIQIKNEIKPFYKFKKIQK